MSTEVKYSTSWRTVQKFLQTSDRATVACFKQVNWDELCRIASDANGGLGCTALDRVTSGSGLEHVIRQLEFSDKTRWLARVPIVGGFHPASAQPQKLKNEIAAMRFINDNSQLKAPRVFAYDTDVENAAGAPFVLVEMLPGIVATDACGGHKVHHGQIPEEHRKAFYRSIAKCHVQMTSLRLPQIGSVVRREDGGYEAGPIPGIGGPFDTAAAFFAAWADSCKFGSSEEFIAEALERSKAYVKDNPSFEEMMKIINEFPALLGDMAEHLPFPNEGPFPLFHTYELFQSSIMVDEGSFEMTAVLDWESAWACPWAVVGFPGSLDTMPPSFGCPEDWDQDGQPLTEQTKRKWREQREYIEMVKEAEGEDGFLSTALSNSLNQSLAYTFGRYNHGKLGFYNKIAAELKKACRV